MIWKGFWEQVFAQHLGKGISQNIACTYGDEDFANLQMTKFCDNVIVS